MWWLLRPEPVAVEAAEVARGRVESTVANTRAGTIMAGRRARIAPTTSGQITELPVREGDQVEAGTLLMALWNEDVRAELALARSQAEAAGARAEQSCLKAEAAAREARRVTRLRERDLASEEEVDRKVSESKALEAACRAARADAEVARDRMAVAEAALARTRLHAPFAGVIAEVNGELGEIVTPSPIGVPTPPAVDLIDPSAPYVSAPIDEVDAPSIAVDMPARITLDAFPDRRFAGRVSRIAPYVLDVEKQARTVEVEVRFTEPDTADRLLPGYSADVEILLAAHDDVLRVPTEAVLEGPRVLVLDADGYLASREIDTGLSNWEYTEVTAGLSEGERVVTSVTREGVQAGVPATLEPGAGGR
ncbi:MAG: efflux RND transporter periplasmic adaptor subunit [Gammaproteobacteria bacterium]|nr:efflux RND transporter periplasmic adaptor subunit [Gammaproteobacteria bacterium]